MPAHLFSEEYCMNIYKKVKCKINSWDWDRIHRSNLIQGLLQLGVAVIISLVFPYVQESNRSINQQKAEIVKKQEEMLTKFCSSFSFTLTLNDEIRSCHERLKCNNMEFYGPSCEKVLSKGTLEFASKQDTFDAVCSVASVYYSQKIKDMLKQVNDDVTLILGTKLPKCGFDDSEYYSRVSKVTREEYPTIVEAMREEILMSQSKLQ